MSEIFERIRDLVKKGSVRISEHGYDELSVDGLTARELVNGVATGEMLENYPDFRKGPCCLVLQYDSDGSPIHAVWGVPKGYDSPAVLVTAYRPNAEKWTSDFRRRRK